MASNQATFPSLTLSPSLSKVKQEKWRDDEEGPGLRLKRSCHYILGLIII